MSGKYYAVKEGRAKGIFRTWKECSESIKGWHNACYKSFATEKEAKEFLSSGIDDSDISDMVKIYTDGSGKGGYGIVIFYKDKKYTSYGKIPFDSTSQGAELYAIFIALSLIKNSDVVLYTDSQYSINNLTSYRTHDKLNTVSNYNLLVKIDDLMKNRKVIFKHVDGHSTVEYNNECDRLANQGSSSKKSFVLYCDGEFVQEINI